MDWAKKLLVVLLIAALAVILVLLFFAVLRVVNRNKARKMIESGKREGALLYRAVRAAYPGAAVFRNLKIPVTKKDGTRAFIRSELTVVGRSGITLIASYPYGGKIDNPYHGDWMAFDGEEPVSFRNPLERGAAAAAAIGKNLKKQGLNNIPLTPLAVFLGDHLFFNHESDRVLRLDEFLDRLDALSGNGFLSSPERKAVCRILSGYAAKKQ